MTGKEIIYLLRIHSIPYKVENGQILADSMEGGTEIFEKMVNMTGWTKRQLLSWLGY